MGFKPIKFTKVKIHRKNTVGEILEEKRIKVEARISEENAKNKGVISWFKGLFGK